VVTRLKAGSSRFPHTLWNSKIETRNSKLAALFEFRLSFFEFRFSFFDFPVSSFDFPISSFCFKEVTAGAARALEAVRRRVLAWQQ